ncbi:MAG: NAD(P)/FAD-dependent oxidoreductase [Candidatus Magnetoovum sp. WYHC-5]|nr:NAD(P)/FAD-dependent oxidoreductase [Candidatus Magnetoovum sp. WYHC-5]
MPEMNNTSGQYRGKGGLPKVVVIGAGFAGLWLTKKLSGKPLEVVLVDKTNYHTFLPLLYQAAAAEVEPESIAYPIRSIIRKMPNVRFIMADIKEINYEERLVIANDITIDYDFLVIAIGSATQFFDTPGTEEYAFQLKNLEHAIMLRSQILRCFEKAMVEKNDDARRKYLTFTVIGGGATGVEFAGALAELIYGPLKKDFPSIDFQEVKIYLIEAASGVLLTYPNHLREYTVNSLRQMGVNVILETFVTHITVETVHLKDKGVIPTETVVWTAGVRGAPIAEKWGLPITRSGRIEVLQTLQLEKYSEIYVIGDLAAVMANDNKHHLPMLAPVATQQGSWAATNILRQINKKPPLPFKYLDKGTMVTIGRKKAIAMVGKRTFNGFIAWVMWLFIHLYNLIGFKNRLMVLVNWANDYIFYEKSIRLILPYKRSSIIKKQLLEQLLKEEKK